MTVGSIVQFKVGIEKDLRTFDKRVIPYKTRGAVISMDDVYCSVIFENEVITPHLCVIASLKEIEGDYTIQIKETNN